MCIPKQEFEKIVLRSVKPSARFFGKYTKAKSARSFLSLLVWIVLAAVPARQAIAQLLPPDAVDLSKVKIAEFQKAIDLCPVTLAPPDPLLPIFEHEGIPYRAFSKEAENQFKANPDSYLEAAKYQRWENNFLRAMSPIWCPVTDQVNPGGFGKYRQRGLDWQVCCQFCNPAFVPDCFALAEKRLKERAKKAYELTGGAYSATPISNPIEGALRAAKDWEGNRILPKLTATTIQDGVISNLGAAPIEDARFDRAYGEWRHYGGDRGHNRYSSLNQINAKTIHKLEVAWRWKSVDAEVTKANPRLRPGPFKPTPLMIGGVLFTSTCFSQVAAIHAATGETIWVHDPQSYTKGRPANSGFQHRGVEYWTDGTEHRILIATGGRQLLSIDALTGKPDPQFGEDGVVDLTKGLGRKFDQSRLGYNSPVVVCRNTIVVGSVIFDYPRHPTTPPGHVRGFDVRTGKRKWIFHTIPQEGEFGNDTWEKGSWKNMGNVNVWSTMSADEELGYVYLPIGTPTNDYYGGHRPGDNLFADSLVCLDAETGKRIWHFQGVHHGLWDYDFCSGPNLVDIQHKGKTIPAVAQVSKQGFTYVFNRKTGQPIWPIEERKVPPSDVPGERASPTQPFPTKPPAFERQTIFEDDLIDFTPELRKEAIEIVSKYRHGPMFLPPSVPGTGGKKGSLILPSAGGGANWAGSAVHPEQGILFVPSWTRPLLFNLRKSRFKWESSFRYNIAYGTVPGPKGLPLIKPPYSRITAINLNQGDIAWQIPHGDGPRYHPAIRHLNTGPLGYAGDETIGKGGGILTGGLFIAIQFRDRTYDQKPAKQGGLIDAFDQQTGQHLWQFELDGLYPLGTPMTYLHQGKQYLVVACNDRAGQGQLIGLALAE